MPKICSKCEFYSASGEESACPTCQGPLQFTLLPPPNQEAAPLEGVAKPVHRWGQPAGATFGGGDGDIVLWITRNWLVVTLVAPFCILMLLLAIGIGTGGGGPGAARAAYDRLQIGMDEDAVFATLCGCATPSIEAPDEDTEVITIPGQMVLVLRGGVLAEKRWTGPEPKGK